MWRCRRWSWTGGRTGRIRDGLLKLRYLSFLFFLSLRRNEGFLELRNLL
jgi:hypothetical protein